MGVVIGSPLQQGALSQRYPEIETGAPWLSPPRQKQYQRLYGFLAEIEMSLPEAALRMMVATPEISTVLMGARSVEEVEQNVRAVKRDRCRRISLPNFRRLRIWCRSDPMKSLLVCRLDDHISGQAKLVDKKEEFDESY